MHPFPDYATARFVGSDSGGVALGAPSRQQNAVPRRGRCKRHRSHRQKRICRVTSIAPSRAEPAVRRPAGEICATVSCRSCRRSIVTTVNKIKTAAAARPKPNDHHLLDASVRRHGFQLASDTDALRLSRACPMRSKRTGDGGAGRSFLSSFSSSEKSFIAVAKFSSSCSMRTDTATLPCFEKFPGCCQFR